MAKAHLMSMVPSQAQHLSTELQLHKDEAPYYAPLTLVQNVVSAQLAQVMESAGIDTSDDHEVQEFEHPFLEATIEELASQLLELHDDATSLNEYETNVLELLGKEVPHIIQRVRNQSRASVVTETGKTSKMLRALTSSRAKPSLLALREIEQFASVEPITRDHRQMLKEFYASRLLQQKHAYLFKMRKFDELKPFTRKGFYIGDFERDEGPRLDHLFSSNERMQAGTTKAQKFAQETMVGRVLMLRGLIKACGWYGVAPFKTSRDAIYLSRNANLVKKWPTDLKEKEELQRLLSSGRVAFLEMIHGDQEFAAGFLHTKLNVALQERAEELRRRLAIVISYAVGDIKAREETISAPYPQELRGKGFPIGNKASLSYLGDCGLDQIGPTPVDFNDEPWATHSLTTSEFPDLQEDVKLMLYPEIVNVSGRANDVCYSTQRFYNKKTAAYRESL